MFIDRLCRLYTNLERCRDNFFLPYTLSTENRSSLATLSITAGNIIERLGSCPTQYPNNTKTVIHFVALLFGLYLFKGKPFLAVLSSKVLIRLFITKTDDQLGQKVHNIVLALLAISPLFSTVMERNTQTVAGLSALWFLRFKNGHVLDQPDYTTDTPHEMKIYNATTWMNKHLLTSLFPFQLMGIKSPTISPQPSTDSETLHRPITVSIANQEEKKSFPLSFLNPAYN